MTSHIIYTREDGGVNVCHPAREFISGWLSHGDYWHDKPLGWVDAWIERRTAEGRKSWAVEKFARAAQRGGCTTAEALAVIRDFDCAHMGTAFELRRHDELPDRWFRNAWRRSHNGGPIMIDMPVAREIQIARIASAIDAENSRRSGWLGELRGLRPLEIASGPISDRIHKAQTPNDIRRIWPEELSA